MGGIRVLPIVALAIAAVLAQPASAGPRGKGQIKAVGKAHGAIWAPGIGQSGRRDGTTIRVIRRNEGDDHRIVRILDNGLFATDGFHGRPPGLGKRHHNLPYGLKKRRIDNLPNLPWGLAKDHPIPPGLADGSQRPPGLSK